MNDYCEYCDTIVDLRNNIYYDFIVDESSNEVLFFCNIRCSHLWTFGDSDTETDSETETETETGTGTG